MFNYELTSEEKIKEAIIHVVVFFDLFEYPLTAHEIWYFLDKKISFCSVIYNLENLAEISSKNGFFFLLGNEEILNTRRKRYNYSLRKIKIAHRFVRLFKFLPFIKVIALSNSIGQFNLRDGSDIDFFIITSPRRIWLTRFICAGITKILNRRPTPKNKKDKICLSFYVTEENLNLSSLKLNDHDPYFFFWLRSLFLLYNKDKVYEKFLMANNLLPLGPNSLAADKMLTAINSIFNISERIVKKIQFIIMSPDLKRAMNNSTGVVINDKVLKLYLRDNRQEYAEKYGNKIRQVFAKND